MKVILWSCLKKYKLEDIEKKGVCVLDDVKAVPGGVYSSGLIKKEGKRKLYFPLIFLSKDDCYGIWLEFESLREIKDFMRKIEEEIKRFEKGKYKKIVEELENIDLDRVLLGKYFEK